MPIFKLVFPEKTTLRGVGGLRGEIRLLGIVGGLKEVGVLGRVLGLQGVGRLKGMGTLQEGCLGLTLSFYHVAFLNIFFSQNVNN